MPEDAVVVGASAGGVEALRALVAGLPVDFPAPVVVVLHIPRNSPSALPAILQRASPLPVQPAAQALPLRSGTIFVAPADRHVLITDDHLHLSAGPTENGHRPAIDPLFRSAALAFGSRAVGVVLSGTRDDGTAGLVAIAGQQGAAFVQDPTEALYGAMPRNALEHVPDAKAYPAEKLGGELAELLAIAERSTMPQPAHDDMLAAENDVAAMAPGTPGTAEWEDSAASGLSCPSCEGVLFTLPDRPAPRFRCRVGHAWSPDSLAGEHAAAADGALWVALRALEEKSALLRSLAEGADRRGRARSAEAHRGKARRADTDADEIRRLIAEATSAADERAGTEG